MRTLISVCSLAIGLSSPPAWAGTLPVPEGRVILTVEGNVTNTNANGTAQFDISMLDALPQRTTVTETPWYDEEQTFSGPLAAALLEAIGASGSTATVIALNDYSADIPLADFLQSPVILATRLNGVELSVRDKGPLFVIYPFDVEPDLYNEVYFGRSVWQITSITIR